MLCAIPIEIVNRELDSVLYTALHLAKRGIPTLFGDYMVRKIMFKLNPGKPVIYFDQDQHLKDNRAVLDAGGVVFNLNQEGLVLEESMEQPDYERAVEALDALFAWGEIGKANIIARIPKEKHGLIKVTGHPSFDLANERFVPFYRDESIIEEFGEGHIQVNTNFSYGNLKMDFQRYVEMLSKMDEWRVYADPEVQKYIWRIHDHQKALLEEYMKMVKALSNGFPDRKIVLRPHPMEDRQRYLHEFERLPNVTVNNEKPVRNWIASAGCVIHHDCTTGVEGLLMGASVIGYRPVPNKEATSSLFGRIGTPAATVAEVADAVRCEMDPVLRKEQLDILSPYLANLEVSAASKIAECAANVASFEKTWLPDRLGPMQTLECWRKHLSKLLRSRQPGHNGRKVRYALEKFPLTSLDFVSTRMEKLRKSEPSLPAVRLEQMALNTFLMTPEGMER